MTMIAVIAIIALLFHVPIGAGSSPYNWSIVVSFACGLILWATTIYILSTARHLLRRSKQHTVASN
jgi:phosphatidylglycerophosphate synthase